MDTQLDNRKITILKAIIKTYLETGEPVGSRTISKYSELKLSSATIRNEMSDLEEMGYIIQPHTSAGRIPSDKGYRFYVDQIMQEKDNEVTEFKDMMVQKVDKLELVLKRWLRFWRPIPIMRHDQRPQLPQDKAEIYPAVQSRGT